MPDATPPESGPRPGRHACSSLSSLVGEFTAALGRLIERGNSRQFILRTADGRTLLRLPATLAVFFGLLLLWKAAPLLLIAVVVALVLKVQFIIASDAPLGEARKDVTPPTGL